ncbi:chitin binding Peritrophin-A domain protein [Oesophagostomum dentatum]|uniref:Chitin binding Peritrophin-A domain protein n=1 Tax=Oesophagostomum dentatum TaxID=61180 RepID=A0A0B1T8S2_OESDE|nr:chitin binding Peritrophin-A domain protein [Oesophagostomum dentatum]
MNMRDCTQNRCLNGDTIPSTDCKSYQICIDGSYRSAACFGEHGGSAVACSHCSSRDNHYAYQINQLTFPGQCQLRDRVPHPHDCAAYYVCVGKGWEYKRCESGMMYNSYTKTCIPANPYQCSSSAQVQCRNGDRIIHKNSAMCNRVTECRNGNWIDLECPPGFIYGNDVLTFVPRGKIMFIDATIYNCIRGYCRGGHQYPEVLPPLNQPVTTYGSRRVVAPSSNLVEQIPEAVAPSCSGNTRAPDQYDCSRFWECGPSGKFQSMVCPMGMVYNVRRRECVQGSLDV